MWENVRRRALGKTRKPTEAQIGYVAGVLSKIVKLIGIPDSEARPARLRLLQLIVDSDWIESTADLAKYPRFWGYPSAILDEFIKQPQPLIIRKEYIALASRALFDEFPHPRPLPVVDVVARWAEMELGARATRIRIQEEQSGRTND